MRRKNKDMNRIDGLSLNLVRNNIEKIKELFPEAVEEGKIDFDMLRAMLGDEVDDSKEKYQFTWNGKAKSIKLAQTPSSATLRPCKEKSKNWDTTENLYVEGDNLEVLKQLQKTYYGKIKMIYIDPPYNTGNDFVYHDDFKNSIENYKEQTNQTISSNPESNGRFHTDWLNMMYPRLILAKNLLNEKGIIFISIDDNEYSKLKQVCDEIFGETNHISTFIWNTDGHTDNQFLIKINHEYILCYAKNIKNVEVGYVIDPNTRKESNLWKGFAENSITKNGEKNPPIKILLKKGFPCKVNEMYMESNNPGDSFWKDVKKAGYISRQTTEKYNVQYPIRLNYLNVKDGKLVDDVEVFSGWANSNKLKKFMENKFEPLKEDDGDVSFYLSDKGVIYYLKKRTKARNIVSVLRNFSTTEQMRSELEKNNVYFSYPKPRNLIEYLIKVADVTDNDIILDFFSGSASTADAVMHLNLNDGNKRNFIMVQLPEICDEKSDAYKAGYKNICEIGEVRIRRAGEQIKAEWEKEHPSDGLFGSDEEFTTDIGFKVFKLDSTNVNEWDPNMKLDEKELAMRLGEVFKEDRSKEDILYEIMLKYGVFDKQVEEIDVNGKTMYRVGKRYMIVCLEDCITSEDVKGIGELSPRTVIFNEAGFNSDNDKINAVYNLEKAGVEDVKCI